MNEKPIRKRVLGKSQAEVRDKLKQAIELSQRLDVARAGSYTVEAWLNTEMTPVSETAVGVGGEFGG